MKRISVVQTIFISAAIIGIIVGLITIYQFVKPSPPSPPQPPNTSQGTTRVTQSLPTPTTPPHTVLVNKIIPQTSGLPDYPFQFLLKSITYYSQMMSWNFVVTNNNTMGESMYFNTLSLIDATGIPTNAQGDGIGQNNAWNLASGGSIPESPTFLLVPQQGMQYTLKMVISAIPPGYGDTIEYGTIKFPFPN